MEAIERVLDEGEARKSYGDGDDGASALQPALYLHTRLSVALAVTTNATAMLQLLTSSEENMRRWLWKLT